MIPLAATSALVLSLLRLGESVSGMFQIVPIEIMQHSKLIKKNDNVSLSK